MMLWTGADWGGDTRKQCDVGSWGHWGHTGHQRASHHSHHPVTATHSMSSHHDYATSDITPTTLEVIKLKDKEM